MSETTVADRPLLARALHEIPWAVISSLLLAVALVFLIVGGPRSQDLVSELGSQIRCPVCQGVPIAESNSQMASDMMKILRQEVDSGATRQEAIDAVIGSYPGSILLDPPLSASSVALWLIPAMALAAGVGLALTIRRGRRGSGADTESADLEHRLDQVQTDLDELAQQVAAGEVEQEAAGHLRVAYEAELAETQSALAEARAQPAALPRSRRRMVVGTVLLVLSLAAIVVAAGAFIVDRPGADSGVAGLKGDPSQYSNETLAAVIAANQDNPLIDGMRLALAERYFNQGDYQSAFPYYMDVASSDQASTDQVATALTRLGWMAYVGNGEIDTALNLLGQARSLVPDDPFPLYMEALVTWCGKGDAASAAPNLKKVLDSPDLDPSIRGQIQTQYEQAAAGADCSQ